MITTTKHKLINNSLNLGTSFFYFSFDKEFYIILLILRMKMVATSYDGTCKNCGANLSVWIEVREKY